MKVMITDQRRDMLRWTAESVAYCGGTEARLYPHSSGRWLPWMTGRSAPHGLIPPARHPGWRDVNALVRSGHLRRATHGGGQNRPIDERVHTMTTAGLAAIGKERK